MSTTAANPNQVQEPIERVRTDIHTLLRRSMRIVAPATPEAEAERRAAIKRLDEEAWAYNEWLGFAAQAMEQAAALKPGIQATIMKLGTVPDGAPKSIRVDTPSFICTATTGTSLEIEDETVLEFDLAMNAKPLREIFDQLFVRHVEYTLAPTAHQMMTHGKLPQSFEGMIRQFYSRCFSAKAKTPSLTVESKDAIKQKQLAAAKLAEEKAAKKKTGKAAV